MAIARFVETEFAVVGLAKQVTSQADLPKNRFKSMA
jgi:hypothetical protein